MHGNSDGQALRCERAPPIADLRLNGESVKEQELSCFFYGAMLVFFSEVFLRRHWKLESPLVVRDGLK